MSQVPQITADLPGVGGTIRVAPEDFEVEELPAYVPSGRGDHLLLWVEKRGLNTRDVAKAIAGVAGVPEREVGVAGQKDRHALTRQFFSIPRGKLDVDAAATWQGEGWRTLSARAHENKLKLGHLRGNRFTVTIRGCLPGALDRARAVVDALARRGLPNAFGPQRFGRGGVNSRVGAALVKGERTSESERVRRDRFGRKMALSAYQALLFNRALEARMREGLFDKALDGDLMKKLETGGLFLCEAPEVDTPRVERFEISPTGPLFGHRMMAPKGEAAVFERRTLDAEGLTLESFAPFKGDGEGSRRPYRIPVTAEVEASGADLTLRFLLPKGSFATALLSEVMKSEAAACELVDERD